MIFLMSASTLSYKRSLKWIEFVRKLSNLNWKSVILNNCDPNSPINGGDNYCSENVLNSTSVWMGFVIESTMLLLFYFLIMASRTLLLEDENRKYQLLFNYTFLINFIANVAIFIAFMYQLSSSFKILLSNFPKIDKSENVE